MTPDEQQSALARCLALQPLVGWPEWTAQYNPTGKYSLREHTDSGASRWHIHGIRDAETEWRRLGQLESHEALCLCQDHLLRWVTARSVHESGAGLEITARPDHYVVEYARGSGWDGEADTLIEALLNLCEQIQKGTDANTPT